MSIAYELSLKAEMLNQLCHLGTLRQCSSIIMNQNQGSYFYVTKTQVGSTIVNPPAKGSSLRVKESLHTSYPTPVFGH